MKLIGILLAVFISFIIAAAIGIGGATFVVKMQDRRLINEARKFLEGKKENNINIEGKIYDVRVFKIPSEKEGVVNVIDVKGGISVKDERQGKEIEHQDQKNPGKTQKKRINNSIFGR